jgi:hypothetical protein
MNEGTASERAARWLSGEREPDGERHMAQCEKCGEELARMESALSGFRGAVRDWSARHAGSGCPDSVSLANAGHARTVRRMRWTLVTAALAVMVALPSWKALHNRQQEAEADRADAVLLERVSYHLSQPAPSPLEPIQDMFTTASEGAAPDGAGEEETLKGEEMR